MEDVLELYHQPYDPARPVICMDETNKQLVGETRTPVPARRGQPRRIDYEYERRGTADVFLFTEPLGNWRCVQITETRTRVDWAKQIKDLVDVYYPEATQIRLVMDNLNTHSIGSLYEAAEAWQLAERGRNRAPVLTVQCLSRRIGDAVALRREVAAWEKVRNDSDAYVNWQFTTADARIHLRQLYPRIEA